MLQGLPSSRAEGVALALVAMFFALTSGSSAQVMYQGVQGTLNPPLIVNDATSLSQDLPPQPETAYPFLRYDEDWRNFCSALADVDKTKRLKCVHLGNNAQSILTLAGEAKEVYESYTQQYWGDGPQGS